MSWFKPIGRGLEDFPALKGLGLSDLGYPERVFVLVTDSLLFVTQEGTAHYRSQSDRNNAVTLTQDLHDPNLSAYRLDSGELVGRVTLPANATGSPITYMVNNRQYIVVPVGGSGLPSRQVALALPE